MKGCNIEQVPSDLSSQKGITPVISTVLLLMIAVAMVGFAFVWFGNIWKSSAASTEMQIRSTQQNMMMTVRLENANPTAGQISIRNTGMADIPFQEITVYVNTNQKACSSWSPNIGVISKGAVANCVITGGFVKGNEIKISSPGTEEDTMLVS